MTLAEQLRQERLQQGLQQGQFEATAKFVRNALRENSLNCREKPTQIILADNQNVLNTAVFHFIESKDYECFKLLACF